MESRALPDLTAILRDNLLKTDLAGVSGGKAERKEQPEGSRPQPVC